MTPENRSRWRWLAALLLAAWALAGCAASQEAPPPVTPSPSPAPTLTASPAPSPTPVVVSGVVSLWHSWEDETVPALLRRIAEFQKLYPNVLFDVTYVPSADLRLSYQQAALEGRGPTLLIGEAEWGPDLASQGFVADLTPLAGAETLNLLNPAGVETGRYQGALISLPLQLRGVALYRNARLISSAPTTYEELVSLAQEATEGDRFGAALERSFYFSGGHLFGLGGSLFTLDGAPAFDSPQGLAWVNLLQSFHLAGPAIFGSDEDLALFKEGRAGFILEGTWQRQALAEAIGAAYLSIDPWPLAGEGSLSGFVQAEAIYLHPRALQEPHSVSWKFLEYLLTPESQQAVADVGLIPALHGSPVNLASHQVSIADPLIVQAMQALTGGAAYPSLPEMPAVSAQMDIALRSVFEDSLPANQALQAAGQQIIAARTPAPAPTP
jgi:ABC-type glycerol-3-phosphate transport system substrate-binding protein